MTNSLDIYERHLMDIWLPEFNETENVGRGPKNAFDWDSNSNPTLTLIRCAQGLTPIIISLGLAVWQRKWLFNDLLNQGKQEAATEKISINKYSII